MRAIGVASGRVTTEHLVVELPVEDGEVRASVAAGPRQAGEHRAPRRPGTIGLGFVTGLGLQRGAVGEHDRARQPQPARRRDERRGHALRGRAPGRGAAAGWSRSPTARCSALVELPIAGLMSDRPVAELAEQTLALERAYRQLGSPIESPEMIFSFLSLGVIPALRLTNRGLVDARRASSSSRRSSASTGLTPKGSDPRRLLRAALLLRGRHPALLHPLHRPPLLPVDRLLVDRALLAGGLHPGLALVGGSVLSARCA